MSCGCGVWWGINVNPSDHCFSKKKGSMSWKKDKEVMRYIPFQEQKWILKRVCICGSLKKKDYFRVHEGLLPSHFLFFCNCISIKNSTKTLKGTFCCQVQWTRRLISSAYALIIYIYILFVFHRHRWPRFKHRIHWESDSFSQMSYNVQQHVLLLLKLPFHFLHVPNE